VTDRKIKFKLFAKWGLDFPLAGLPALRKCPTYRVGTGRTILLHVMTNLHHAPYLLRRFGAPEPTSKIPYNNQRLTEPKQPVGYGVCTYNKTSQRENQYDWVSSKTSFRGFLVFSRGVAWPKQGAKDSRGLPDRLNCDLDRTKRILKYHPRILLLQTWMPAGPKLLASDWNSLGKLFGKYDILFWTYGSRTPRTREAEESRLSVYG
jgi:hypothetical protein